MYGIPVRAKVLIFIEFLFIWLDFVGTLIIIICWFLHKERKIFPALLKIAVLNIAWLNM